MCRHILRVSTNHCSIILSKSLIALLLYDIRLKVNPNVPVIINIIAMPDPLPTPTIPPKMYLAFSELIISGSKILSAKNPPAKYPIGTVICCKEPRIEKILPCIVVGIFEYNKEFSDAIRNGRGMLPANAAKIHTKEFLPTPSNISQSRNDSAAEINIVFTLLLGGLAAVTNKPPTTPPIPIAAVTKPNIRSLFDVRAIKNTL
ncbi:hypothetical protein [Clostridium estertheticum]|uniref:hypothetical protein n=1 Tax=Clostridium estertheticum TaxID=238834 RepID=UPI00227B2643|nr:hypothetical protein [Clostridium estertheticum]